MGENKHIYSVEVLEEAICHEKNNAGRFSRYFGRSTDVASEKMCYVRTNVGSTFYVNYAFNLNDA